MFSPGFGRCPPSLGFDCTGLVASGSSELEAALPVHSVRSLCRSLALVRADDSLHLVSSLSAEHFGLWPYGLAIAALPLVSRPWTCLCWSHLLSLSSGGSVRGYTAPVGWLRGVFPCFAYCPTSCVLKQSSFGFSASCFALSLRDGVTRSERRLFLHLPGGWCLAFAMGSPISGRVALFCALDRNEGFFHSSILSCFAMGSPCGSRCGFPHSIGTKPALVSCLIFLQDGVPLSGLDL